MIVHSSSHETVISVIVLNGQTAGPFTLFAPTDDAFGALPAGALDSLVANPAELKKVLLSHVVPGTAYSRGLSTGKLTLARGGTVPVVVNSSMPNSYHHISLK